MNGQSFDIRRFGVSNIGEDVHLSEIEVEEFYSPSKARHDKDVTGDIPSSHRHHKTRHHKVSEPLQQQTASAGGGEFFAAHSSEGGRCEADGAGAGGHGGRSSRGGDGETASSRYSKDNRLPLLSVTSQRRGDEFAVHKD